MSHLNFNPVSDIFCTNFSTGTSDDHDDNRLQAIDICDIVDLAQLPYIEICSTTETVDDLAGTFEIHMHQYVATLRNPGRDTNSAIALSGSSSKFWSIMPVECTVPDTARWRSKGIGSKETNGKRLVPRKNTYVSITGFITSRHSTASNKCFCVCNGPTFYLIR